MSGYTTKVSSSGQRFLGIALATRLLSPLLLVVALGYSLNGTAQPQASSDKQAMIELGLQNETAWDLFQTLRSQAEGDGTIGRDEVPDWRGLYMRAFNLRFDVDQTPDQLTTATLTPEYEARLIEKIRLATAGIEYDPISDCSPPGFPRWLHIPFLREFVVTPYMTLLMSEVVNSVRRIYTDGRGHVPEEDRYPLYYGDSIGFWDRDRLIIHTNQLRAGAYTRRNPDHSGQVETVEIWERIDDRTIEARVWVYDPPSLLEPWYTMQTYQRISNDDRRLRIRYWHCGENPNNVVIQTEEGASDFADFTFD